MLPFFFCGSWEELPFLRLEKNMLQSGIWHISSVELILVECGCWRWSPNGTFIKFPLVPCEIFCQNTLSLSPGHYHPFTFGVKPTFFITTIPHYCFTLSLPTRPHCQHPEWQRHVRLTAPSRGEEQVTLRLVPYSAPTDVTQMIQRSDCWDNKYINYIVS